MPKWNLMRLAVDADGARTLAPLTKEQELLAPWYETLLLRASEAKCTDPRFSGYHVRACAAAGELTIARGGNVEYGKRSLHAEATAIAALFSLQNSTKHRTTPVLALVAGHGPGTIENFTMPCGDCRDFLLDTVGPDCVILCGTMDGGTAMVATLADALFEDYQRVPTDSANIMSVVIDAALKECHHIGKNFHADLERHPAGDYIVVLSTGTGPMTEQRFFGALSLGDDYHSLYPAEMAVLQAEMRQDPYIKSVTIIGVGNDAMPPRPPKVLYRDRQRLLELAIDRELLTDVPCNPPVHLLTHAHGMVTGTWTTSLNEWLPMPFSRGSFLKKESLARYIEKLHEKYD